MRKVAFIFAAFLVLSASAAEPKDTIDGRYFRLFAPTTFYHNIANKSLSIEPDQTSDDPVAEAIDAALLHIYLNRPDLVNTTETELQEIGNVRADVNQPIKNQVKLVEKVESPVIDMPDDVPTEIMIQKPKFWTKKGDGYLQFMQNFVSDNWYKGGESNYSMVGALTLEANYDNRNKWKWDNKLEAKLGFLRSSTDSVHKFKTNEDLIRLTSKLGLEAAKNWYYTLQLVAYTQFTKGYKSNDPNIYSDFMSPFNLNLGLGMDYKVNKLDGKLQGTINLSPLAMNYRYVDRLDLGPSFGIDPGKHSKLDFGPNVTADLEWKMNDNVTWKTRFYAFTSFHRVEIEWENTLEFRVSKYITANLFLYPRYDDASVRDDDLGYWEFKEFCSIGFAYKF